MARLLDLNSERVTAPVRNRSGAGGLTVDDWLRLSGEGVHDDLNPRALCRRGVVECTGDAGRATSDDDNRD